MNYLFFFLVPVLIYCINFYIVKSRYFLNFSGENHQKILGAKNTPLSGGIFLILFLSIIFLEKDITTYIFLILIFVLGLFSDLKILSIPSRRLFYQSILIILFVYFSNFETISTRIIFIDQALQNYYIGIFFSAFCLIILINGTNFIDGLNGLVLTYYLIVLAILYKLNLLIGINFTDLNFIHFCYLLFVLIIFNFLNKFYLGDSGAYLLGLLIGFILIKIHNSNPNLSPFFVVLLLWYPCFENLFSILRKFKLGKSPVSPDSKHFHQLLFYFLKKKFKLNDLICNNYSSVIINLYNFVVLFFGSYNIYNTQFLIVLILINIIVYTSIYLKLFNFKYKILISKKK
jgi:UDP-N-acetylmuramyl pentapeptide phosphotransferase/UDP-N-acetylglucosamine-1-phosphate transferase